MATQAEIIRWWKGKSCLTKRKKELDTIIKSAQKELEVLNNKLRYADSINQVIDGVPIKDFGNSYSTVEDYTEKSSYRSAEWYPNANNNGKTWGLRLCCPRDPLLRLGREERWMGCNFKSEKLVKAIAQHYVVYGKVLSEEEV
jgi:hypothetical protein